MKAQLNVVVSHEYFFHLINLAICGACFEKDTRIVFTGTRFYVELGDNLSKDIRKTKIVAGVFRHKYFSNLKMIKNTPVEKQEKPSPSDPSMSIFSYWLAKMIYRYGNIILNNLYYRGVNVITDKDSGQYIPSNNTIIMYDDIKDLQLIAVD